MPPFRASARRSVAHGSALQKCNREQEFFGLAGFAAQTRDEIFGSGRGQLPNTTVRGVGPVRREHPIGPALKFDVLIRVRENDTESVAPLP